MKAKLKYSKTEKSALLTALKVSHLTFERTGDTNFQVLSRYLTKAIVKDGKPVDIKPINRDTDLWIV